MTGDYRVEHIFVLRQELQFYEVFQKAIAECDQKIEQYLAQFSDQVEVKTSPILPAKNGSPSSQE